MRNLKIKIKAQFISDLLIYMKREVNPLLENLSKPSENQPESDEQANLLVKSRKTSNGEETSVVSKSQLKYDINIIQT